MNETLDLIADYRCHTGEGPMWHPLEKRVYWTDIPNGRMFRYDPATGRHEQFYDGDVVGGFTVQADGALLLFMAKGAVKVWRGGKLTTVIEEIPEERDGRFNDVIADPEGRVFCGTMATDAHPGSLYRLDRDGSIRKVLGGVGVSNGLGFTPDLAGMYYTDSPAREIYLFDYARASGEISGQRVFVKVPADEGEGFPDGMTVDADGCVWSARWDGGCLVRYTPDGREDRRIHFPARKVSSAGWGGDDSCDLYVTCAGGDLKETDGPGAGALFQARPGVQGVPEFLSRIGL
jgi:sugar lactone lactonase YvrE